MHVGVGYGWGPLIAVFVCPNGFPVVYLDECGQPVCMHEVAVSHGQSNPACCGLRRWYELLVALSK